MTSITALLHTKNDALRLGRTLETLYACDDILVVDHGSRDATARVARAYGARIVGARPAAPVGDYLRFVNSGFVDSGSASRDGFCVSIRTNRCRRSWRRACTSGSLNRFIPRLRWLLRSPFFSAKKQRRAGWKSPRRRPASCPQPGTCGRERFRCMSLRHSRWKENYCASLSLEALLTRAIRVYVARAPRPRGLAGAAYADGAPAPHLRPARFLEQRYLEPSLRRRPPRVTRP